MRGKEPDLGSFFAKLSRKQTRNNTRLYREIDTRSRLNFSEKANFKQFLGEIK